jgi:CubicO group peptidase (beta-lactamase class C family)
VSSFEDRARDLAVRDEFAGVIRVDRAGTTISALALGAASRAWNVPVNLETRFDSASITKLFTAVAALQCVEREEIALDTSVVDFLQLTDTRIAPRVTPYHLLTHTSGIADLCDEDAGEDYADVFAERPNYAIKTTADWLPLFVDREPEYSPGARAHYCNAGYLLLGLMVERATGLSYRDYIGEHVFARAAMAGAGFFAMDRVEPNVAEAVDPVRTDDDTIIGWQRNIYAYPPIGAPDGGAHVRAGDLVAFHRALVDGRLLGSELTAAMLRPHEEYQTTRPRFLHGESRAGAHLTGYGFEFERDEHGIVQSYWKEGMSEGASGVLRHYPATDTTVVVLAAGADAAWSVISAIDADLEAGAI